ncbi:uncharacterized protein N7529_005080 [Penicillium soppii]|jgi:hypothetical protein|uniref:uncharacterized protein n=1 Tax=Penicillium soppii TaxID=69789 RepID=UPI0025469285|nr:uncharacterized protein N7529_005080 [Penicillium soppii]KAJ5872727.1 hypothetical protein N7529_005080 [Penicillium soppii]
MSSLPFNKDVFDDNILDPGRLLPASARTAVHTLANPLEDIQRFLKKDLCVGKLNKIDQYLWLAGLPTPPKPLNYQLATSREIAVDERIDMHMVWEHTRRIHLKPVPRYLLDPEFWEHHLSCKAPCCASPCDRIAQTSQACSKNIRQCALGFLCSYIALIQFESDFAIAREYKLLPNNITWDMWLKLVHQLLKSDAPNPANINSRYFFGELRLSRLNKIYAIRHGSVLSAYQYTYQTYAELFHDYLTPLTAATIYVALVLTAMQVGLATTRLGTNTPFQKVSYGFTVFSILGPLIGIMLLGIMGGLAFTNNMMATWRFKRQKFALYEQLMARNQLP